jgi:hypothetical protein
MGLSLTRCWWPHPIAAPALTMCLPKSESGIWSIDRIEIYRMEHLMSYQKFDMPVNTKQRSVPPPV